MGTTKSLSNGAFKELSNGGVINLSRVVATSFACFILDRGGDAVDFIGVALLPFTDFPAVCGEEFSILLPGLLLRDREMRGDPDFLDGVASPLVFLLSGYSSEY